jgi:hypothetical protein
MTRGVPSLVFGVYVFAIWGHDVVLSPVRRVQLFKQTEISLIISRENGNEHISIALSFSYFLIFLRLFFCLFLLITITSSFGWNHLGATGEVVQITPGALFAHCPY